MSDTIEQNVYQRRQVNRSKTYNYKVISESKTEYNESDHPDVDELYNRV